MAPGKQPEADGDVHLRIHGSFEADKETLTESLESLLTKFGRGFRIAKVEAIGGLRMCLLDVSQHQYLRL